MADLPGGRHPQNLEAHLMAVMRFDVDGRCFECPAAATVEITFYSGPTSGKLPVKVLLCDCCLEDTKLVMDGRPPVNRTHTESGPRCPECGWDTELAPMMDDKGRPTKMKCMECLRIWDLVYELSPGEAGTPDSQVDRTGSPAE